MADEIAKLARLALEEAWMYDRDNRKEMLEDLKFVAGFQWPDAAMRERRGRPMITINRSNQFLRQVSNPIRQNMPTLKVEPIDKSSNEEMMEIYNGLLRQIQYNSSASHVYANAVEHAVACGIGWFRVLPDYVDEESFDQEIMIKRVFNPLTVYADPASREPDRSNMSYCLVTEEIPIESFKKRWPKKASTGLDAPSDQKLQTSTFWQSADTVRIAEFWQREESAVTLAQLSNGRTVELTSMGEAQAGEILNSGYVVNTRKAKRHKVKMTLVSGAEQLEEVYECPCQWIPVIPVIGAEIPQEKGFYRHGLIRFQREPQQLHNYFLSVAAETLGQQPKAPYMVEAEQVLPYKDIWDQANKAPLPYLPYKNVEGVAPPKRVEPPPLPTGLIQMAQMLADDMKSTTGIYDAALGNRSNETSGIAIQSRVQQGDQATFHYVDNLEHSLEHLGRILIDMIPKVYDTPRIMRFVGEDGTESEAAINMPARDQNLNPTVINDLSSFKADIRVILGPNYQTRRQEALHSLTELAKADPRLFTIGGDIIVRSMDFPGAEELAERYKAILPPQILGVEDPEAAQAQQPPPDPMAEAMAQTQIEGAQAKTEQEKLKAQGLALDNEKKKKELHGAHLDVLSKARTLMHPEPDPDQAGGPSDGDADNQFQ